MPKQTNGWQPSAQQIDEVHAARREAETLYVGMFAHPVADTAVVQLFLALGRHLAECGIPAEMQIAALREQAAGRVVAI